MAHLTTVIPVYNRERHLRATLESVARQTRRPDRLVVLDNCSTDRSCQIVEQFSEISCELVRNERNLGLFGNWNRALGFAAQTDYLHLLCSDDLITSDFYERLLPVLGDESGRGLVYTYFGLIDDAGNRLPDWLAMRFRRISPIPREFSRDEAWEKLAELQTILLQSSLLKTARQPVPCQFREDMRQVGDCLFVAEWLKHCPRVFQVPQPLCLFRVHAQGASQLNAVRALEVESESWEAMLTIEAMRGKQGLTRWMRQKKLGALHAARMLMFFENQGAENRRSLARQTKAHVGGVGWTTGKLAALVWAALRQADRLIRPSDEDR